MNGTDRFDRVLADWLASSAPASAPEDLHPAAIDRARRSRQRPRWLAVLRVGVPRRATTALSVARRGALVLALVGILILILVAIAVVVGSQRRLPPPFGVTGNGLIAFDSAGAIYVLDQGGTLSQRVPAAEARNSAPTWSPDGHRLAFWADLGRAGFRIVVTASDGSNVVKIPIPSGAVPDLGLPPDWSPDGDHLVFAGREKGVIARMYIVDLVHGSVTPVPTQMLQPFDPMWSPDGQWIAFASRAEGALKTGIYIVHPDGAGIDRLQTSELPDRLESEGFLSWSPDPSRPALLYTFGSDGQGDIAVFDLTRRRETVVTADPPNEFWPSWSPDGRRVAWFGNDGAHDAIRVAELGPEYQVGQIRSAFVSPAAAPGEGPTCGETPSLAGRYMCRPPAWSPDGQRLYALDVLGTTLLVVSVDGSTPPERVALPGGGGFTDWQRVGP